jgi:hypothetical protein
VTAGRRTDNVENKLVARHTNEWIRATSRSFGLDVEPATYRCECSAPLCQSTVTLPQAAYELARTEGRKFVICVNHENPELDCVIWQDTSFAMVQLLLPGALPGPSTTTGVRPTRPRVKRRHSGSR